MFDLGSVVAHIKADLSGFSAGIAQAKSEASSLGEHMQNIGEKMRGYSEQAAGFVAIQAVGFGELAKKAIEVASNFEQTQTSFGTLLGSEQKAADLMKEIMTFEQHTPFDISTLTDAAKGLLAYGVTQKEIVPHLKEFTDMSQGQTFKLKELVSIYGQVNSIQQLNGNEVRRLASIGIPIYDAIGEHFKKMGMSAADGSALHGEAVKKMISSGQVSAQVFDQILTEMTSKGGLYYKENSRQMKTFSGIMSSTKTQIEYAILNIMGIDIGAAHEVRKGGLFDTLRNLAGKLLDGLKKLQPIFKALGENKNFQLVIEGIVIAIASLALILPILVIAFNPVILIVLAIEAVIAFLFWAWSTNFGGIRDITKEVISQVVGFFNNVLMPFIAFFAKYFGGVFIGIMLEFKGTWEIIMGIVKIAWAIIYGILAIGVALLTGDWKRAWKALKQATSAAWSGVQDIFHGILDFLGGFGTAVISLLTAPFRAAWDSISKTVGQIRDALDFTKRHSPSIIDIVTHGVTEVNKQLQKIQSPDLNYGANFASGLVPGMGGGMGIGGNAINIDMSHAVVSDDQTAMALGEKIGDAIVRKLGQTSRY